MSTLVEQFQFILLALAVVGCLVVLYYAHEWGGKSAALGVILIIAAVMRGYFFGILPEFLQPNFWQSLLLMGAMIIFVWKLLKTHTVVFGLFVIILVLLFCCGFFFSGGFLDSMIPAGTPTDVLTSYQTTKAGLWGFLIGGEIPVWVESTTSQVKEWVTGTQAQPAQRQENLTSGCTVTVHSNHESGTANVRGEPSVSEEVAILETPTNGTIYSALSFGDWFAVRTEEGALAYIHGDVVIESEGCD